MLHIPNILVCIALILFVVDLVWPTARLTTVGGLLLAVALLAGTTLIAR